MARRILVKESGCIAHRGNQFVAPVPFVVREGTDSQFDLEHIAGELRELGDEVAVVCNNLSRHTFRVVAIEHDGHKGLDKGKPYFWLRECGCRVFKATLEDGSPGWEGWIEHCERHLLEEED